MTANRTLTSLLAGGLLLAGTRLAQAQSVGIGTTAPDASAALDIVSSSKGALLPRVAAATTLATPATGLIVYQTGSPAGYYYYDGTAWQQLVPAGSGSFVRNQTSQQTGASFNVDGTGTVGGGLTVGGGATVTGTTSINATGDGTTTIGGTGDTFIGNGSSSFNLVGIGDNTLNFVGSGDNTFNFVGSGNSSHNYVGFGNNSYNIMGFGIGSVNYVGYSNNSSNYVGYGSGSFSYVGYGNGATTSIGTSNSSGLVSGPVLIGHSGGTVKVQNLGAGVVQAAADGTLSSSSATTAFGTSFIDNQTSQQTGASFNVDGTGTVGGLLTANSGATVVGTTSINATGGGITTIGNTGNTIIGIGANSYNYVGLGNGSSNYLGSGSSSINYIGNGSNSSNSMGGGSNSYNYVGLGNSSYNYLGNGSSSSNYLSNGNGATTYIGTSNTGSASSGPVYIGHSGGTVKVQNLTTAGVTTNAADGTLGTATVGNGLTLGGGSVALGGTLTQNTTIAAGTNKLSVTQTVLGSATADQSDLTGTVISFDASPGALYQTFQAGVTGSLAQVVLRLAPASSAGSSPPLPTLTVQSGGLGAMNTPTGAVIGTATLTSVTTGSNTFVFAAGSLPALVAGQTYTLGLSNTYTSSGVTTSWAHAGDVYAAGMAGGGGDYLFQTFMQTASAVPALTASSGNVGIGTASPGQKLEVAGTVFSSTGGFMFPDNTVQTTAATSPTAATYIQNNTSATAQTGGFNVSSTGTVGGLLTASGGATVTGTTGINATGNSATTIGNMGNTSIGGGSYSTNSMGNGNGSTNYVGNGNGSTSYVGNGNGSTSYVGSGGGSFNYVGNGSNSFNFMGSGNSSSNYLSNGNGATTYIGTSNTGSAISGPVLIGHSGGTVKVQSLGVGVVQAAADGTLSSSNLTGDIISSGAATTYGNVVPAAKGGAGTVSGLLKANGSGTVSAAVAGTDYLTPTGANTSFIQNTTSQQASSNFNISGNGAVGGLLGVGTGTTAPVGGLQVVTGNAGIGANGGAGAILSGKAGSPPNLELRGSTITTPYIDFAEDNTVDFSTRLLSQNGTLNVNGPTTNVLLQVNGAAGIGGTATITGSAAIGGGAAITGNTVVDAGGANTGTAANFLRFGGSTSGEGIGSQRSGSTGNVNGLDLYTISTPRLSITSAGRVGIGTASPGHPLAVQADGSNRLLGFSDNTGTDKFNFSLAGGGLNLSESNVAGGRLFVQATTGYVGVGTTNPGVPLDVQFSNGNYTVNNYGYLAQSGAGGNVSSSGQQNVSVRASGRMVASEFDAVSDLRLKRVVGLSSGAADLTLLNQLRITDYTMRDRVAFGERRFKKVIAQEVEAVYPQAVQQHTGFLPDVYAPATAVRPLPGDSLVAVELPAGLLVAATVGQRLRLLAPAGEVLAVVARPATPGSATLVLRGATALAGQRVFVYGLEHADVRAVDYEALSMLHVSATQELARKVAALEAQNAALQGTVQTLQRQATQAAASTSSFEQRLRALEAGAGQASR